MGNTASKALKTTLMVIGGCALSLEREPHDSVEIINFKKDASQPLSKARLAVPARGATAHLIDNQIWVLGGCKGPKQHLTTVQLGDLKADRSLNFVESELKLLKERSCHMSAYNAKQKKLYVMGGFDGYESLHDVEVLDLSQPGSTFEALPKLPSRIKNGVAIMNEDDQCIYLIGGWDEKNTLGTVFRYNTLTNTTDFDGQLPKSAEGHACVYIPEQQLVFIFGGFDGQYVSDRVMKYDLKTAQGSIVFGVKLSSPRENHIAQLLGGNKIVVSNGWNGHEALRDADLFQFDSAKGTVVRVEEHEMEESDRKVMRELQAREERRNRPTSVVV